MAGVADEPLVASAVSAAVKQHHPGRGLIHHSDRGCQYAAVTFAKGLAASGLVASFSAKGTPHDNAAKLAPVVWSPVRRSLIGALRELDSAPGEILSRRVSPSR